MKKVLVSAGLIVSGIFTPVSAQVISLLNENFNSGFPTGWLAVDLDGCTPAPAVNAVCGNSFKTHVDYDTISGSDSILVSTSWFQPACTANNLLILPSVTLQNNGNQLVFQYRSKDPSYPEAFQVLVSVTGTNPGDFEDTIYSNAIAEPAWTELNIDLDAYAGQTVYLAVRHNSNDKFIFCLDNFRVFADLQLGKEELSLPKLVLFPNPASDLIHLQYNDPIQNILIMDASGRMVSSVSGNGTFSQSLEIEHLPSGLYLLKVSGPKGTTTRKFFRL